MTTQSEQLAKTSAELQKQKLQAEALEQQLQNLEAISTDLITTLSSQLQEAILSGEKLEITLRDIYLRIAQMALDQAFDPLEKALGDAFSDLIRDGLSPSRNQQRG